MLQKLKLKAESFDSWAIRVKEAMDPKGEKVELTELKELQDEAIHKKFPESELLTALTTAVQDAEKCASVARQLLNSRQRTRTRQSADSKYKLTVEELTQFYNEISNLSCELKEAEGVKFIIDQVDQFQRDAEELEELDNDCDIERLEKCIDYGDAICIELPQLTYLKQKLQQLQWLEEVKGVFEDPKSITRQELGKLIEDGMNIPPHNSVESSLAKLQSLMIAIDNWEDKAKLYLQPVESRQTISAYEDLIREADHIDAFLPDLSNLKEMVNKAKNWCKLVDEIQRRDQLPYYDTLDELVRKGRAIPLHLPVLPMLESSIDQVDAWKDKTAKTFLRKSTPYSLMEVLSPRIGVGLHSVKSRKNNKGEDAIGAVYICDTKLDDSNEPAAVVGAFKLAEQREMEAMKNLRERNVEKMKIEDAKFCVCRKPKFGNMIRCELCKDWFHSTTCVTVPRAPQVGNPCPKFLCPCCLRSRRPRMENILSLLVTLQKIPVRVPEGEALQCLTERAMNWQDRARKALAAEDVAAITNKLNAEMKQAEAAAKEPTPDIKKSTQNSGLNSRKQTVSGAQSDDSVSIPEDDDEDKMDDDEDMEDSDEDVLTIDEDEPSNSGFNSNEHAYSSVSKFASKSSGEDMIPLSSSTLQRLEELMMEGDLLEVELEEINHMWAIVRRTNLSIKGIRSYAPLNRSSDSLGNKKPPQQRGRKRKSDEVEISKKFGRRSVEEKSVAKRKVSKETKSAPVTMRRGPRKIKREEDKAPKRRVGNRKKTKQDTSDEEEDCAADKCLRPNGREVDWVQCDGGCDGWFHMHCVGLDRTELAEDDDYICRNCREPDMMRMEKDDK